MRRRGTFSQAEYAAKKKQTRRDRFLAEMEEVVPGRDLVEWVCVPSTRRENAASNGELERDAGDLFYDERWSGLADEALYGGQRCTTAKRCAALPAIDLSVATVPDATTVLHFRHWLERDELTT